MRGFLPILPVLTLRGVAEVQTLKLDFVVKKWQNEKNLLRFPLDIDFETVKSSRPYRHFKILATLKLSVLIKKFLY